MKLKKNLDCEGPCVPSVSPQIRHCKPTLATYIICRLQHTIVNSFFCPVLKYKNDSANLKIVCQSRAFKLRCPVDCHKDECSVFSDSPPNTVMSSNTSERWTFVPNMGFGIKDHRLKTRSCPPPLHPASPRLTVPLLPD